MPSGNSDIIIDPKSETLIRYERSTGDIVLYRRNVEAGRFTSSGLDLAGVLARADLATESKTYVVPVSLLRVWDARQTNLPGAAANDDMGVITGTFLTDVPTLQGVDFGGASTDEKGAFQFLLPPEYVAGGSVTVRLRAGMVTSVADTACTVDVEVGKANRDGASGADICATAAQSINSLAYANKDFTITPTALSPGDLLDIRLSFAGSDVGNLDVMIPEISQIEIVLDVKG